MVEMEIKSLAVFCGSSTGINNVYIEHAKRFGEELANNNKTLIYGGAQVGCMGALADASLHSGGNVIGVIPQKLKAVEIAHDQLSELHVVNTMHERKSKMAELADGFVALPGGAGTLEEWFEVFTWSQLGYHAKPCGLLNVNNFFDPLITMLDHTIEQGFMNKDYREMIIISPDPKELLEKIDSFSPSHAVKWT
ncbi:putative cytokinin riboside 5'-monophosphate phosphoribohydrolase [Oceanobacillus indicireducens]|uniref:Cytokinin riboside 5'-monophosphate phosphoribohydrolase n=3 Tax=Oceanobacillus TaxID=182709 RepID=A0A918D5W9_9BACI|nr:putative cytokinin riboside 5'-monophosphate phosphoribohydrolase [Oceanobacillus indicireducens]